MLFVAAQTVYGPCNKDVSPYTELLKKGNVTAPIQLAPLVNIPNLNITGKLQIIDGCSFAVTDFVFINGDESYWYGGFKGSNDAVLVSKQYVYASAFPGRIDFQLNQDPGVQVNWGSFNQLRLFSKNINLLLATVDLPSTSTSTGSNNGQTNGQNPETKSNAVGLTPVLPFLALLAL